MSTRPKDAVIVGAGINGMVAAAKFAKAGWSVALLDAAPAIGGFIAGKQRAVPGYVHATYSSWHPLFVTGPMPSSVPACNGMVWNTPTPTAR